MTPKQATKLLPIITAFSEGKTIEVHNRAPSGDYWTVIKCPSWHPDTEYRIKPETKEGWINIYKAPWPSVIHASKEIADHFGQGEDRIACIKITYTEGEGLENPMEIN